MLTCITGDSSFRALLRFSGPEKAAKPTPWRPVRAPDKFSSTQSFWKPCDAVSQHEQGGRPAKMVGWTGVHRGTASRLWSISSGPRMAATSPSSI